MLLGGTPRPIFAHLRVLLADGDGHRVALQWNGATSLKPCFKHWNVVGRDNEGRLHHCPSTEYVDVTEHDPTKFKMWGRGDFLEMVDALVAASDMANEKSIPKVRLEEMQKFLGFKPTREGMLACPMLRRHVDLLSVLRYDWCHTFLSAGVLTTALWNLIDAAVKAKIATQNDLHVFLKEPWIFPKRRKGRGRPLSTLLSEHWAKANSEHEAVKCSASELLTLYGMVRYWAQSRLAQCARPRAAAAASAPDATASAPDPLALPLQSFLLCCRCVDIILSAKGMKCQ